ncbi:MAG: nucleotidyltransferase family protein [Microthrixaceae bacterium]
MSSFHELGDEFAGDEANQEWDAAWEAYTRGAETAPQASPAPLRAVLRLPAGRVELRGDLDDVVLDHFVDLRLPPTAAPTPAGSDLLDTEPMEPLAVITVRAPARADAPPPSDAPAHADAPADWHLEVAASGTVEVVRSGRGADELVDALVAQLEHHSGAADPGHLHLDVACVELHGVGYLLAGGARVRRDALVVELLARPGAAHLTSDDLVLEPGTRAVRGTPMPLRHPGGTAAVPASSLAPIAPYGQVGVIVLLGADDHNRDGDGDGDRDAKGATGEQVDPARAVVELARQVRDGAAAPGLAIELLPTLVAGATCVRLAGDDVAGTAAVIATIRPPERRALVVAVVDDRVAAPAGRRARRGERGPAAVRRSARFDHSAVVDDGDGAGLRVLEPSAADELEARVAASLGERCRPEAFGLPNCPTGATARAAWEGMTILEGPDPADGDPTPSSAPSRGELPSGVAAELLSRDLIASDDDLRARVTARHWEARDLTERVVVALGAALRVADELGVEPVVVGSLVQALDGPLPEHFTDVDRVDLLVRKEHLDAFTEELESRGWQLEARTLHVTAQVGSERRLPHPDRPGVHVELHRTLAAGPFGELVDPEEFHRDAVPFRLGDRWALALRPEHRFVHACLQADRVDGDEGTAQLRDVVLTAPRVASRMAQALECSARWGATTSVLAVVRHADARLPGVPAWLAQRSARDDGRGSRLRRRRAPRT